jgi:hypothetical protein
MACTEPPGIDALVLFQEECGPLAERARNARERFDGRHGFAPLDLRDMRRRYPGCGLDHFQGQFFFTAHPLDATADFVRVQHVSYMNSGGRVTHNSREPAVTARSV